MEEIVLKAEKRTIIGKQVNSLRREGLLPAIIYGKKIQPIPITLDLKESTRILEKVTSSALIVIDVNGQTHYTLVREKQRNPLLGTLRHVDFQAVSLTEKVRADVSLHFIGEAPAVENYFGILVPNLEQIEVECLPRNLPERIDVDLSVLKEIGDSILIRDIDLPNGIEVIDELDEVIIVVTAPVSEIEFEGEEIEAVAGIEPEVVEKGRKEEEIED